MANAAKALAKQAKPEVKKPENKKATVKKVAAQADAQNVEILAEVVPAQVEVPTEVPQPVAPAVVPVESAAKPAKAPKPAHVYSFKQAVELTSDQTAAFMKLNKQAKDLVELVRAAGRPLTRNEIAALVRTVSKSRKPWNIFHWYLVKAYRPAGIVVEAKV